jgi:2-C-methyl-D-erythritol 4-phosphate cytidylyltransferase
MRTIGVILAGGSGVRFGSNKPKQFIRVAGKRIIEHTIEAFQNSLYIDEVAIVTHAGYVDEVEEIVNQNKFSKVKKILLGGSTRSDSSLSAINAYWQEPDKDEVALVFHDAVRPFVSERILGDIHKALNHYAAIDVAIPSTDTIIEVEDDKIVSIPDRSRLMNGQTPQAFHLEVIKEAYDVALNDPEFKATDDCGVVRKYLPHVPVFVVKGHETNIKITHGLDLFISDKVFQLRHKELFDNQDFSKMKDKVLVIFGGNDGIGGATAQLAGTHGAQVFCFSRSLNGVDIRDVEAVRSSLRQVYEQCGRIDYVVNSAAVLNKEPLAHADYQTIFDGLDINLKGAIIVAKESFPYLGESKGHLLNYTSSSYTRGRAFYSVYSSTKSAIVNLTQALAEEWQGSGIRVNCINPERTRTPMRVKNFGIEPEGSLLKVEEVAHASVNTLLHEFTGQLIYVKNLKSE